MTVKELREKLTNLPDDMEVVMSKDEEGNDFKYLYETEVAHTTIDGRGIEVMHPDDYEDLDEEDKKLTVECFVLWP